jgi:EAL domain-containing protein (putative c-di-GMP-specific phosphodiesterase class I)
LRALGVRISMDDFGTGFSSLSYLRSFPFDKIKIDQSFIRDLVADERSQTIVGAIAGLGLSFAMTTTAEGVETQEQMECLIANGCAEVQGFFYSKAVPGGEVSALIGRIGAKR